MSDGGWYSCPSSIIGTTFGVYTKTTFVNFVEIMAYSQDAIQMNAGVSVSYLGTIDGPYLPSNVI